MLNKKFFWLIFSIALSCLSLSAVFSVLAAPSAVTYTVCASGCDFSSIQAAIDAAGPGDTISLAGEIFTEPFTVDRSLTIEGAGAENTILQAAESQALSTSRVITITEGVTATITGVTIRYGMESGSYPKGYGGGIFSRGTLTVSHSTVYSNTAGAGGGIYSNAVLVIINSIVDSNTSEYSGGGIYNGDFYVNDAPQLTLLNSIISNNKSYADSEGGGGLRNSDNFAIISNSIFLNNYAYTGGGGMYTDDGTVILSNCSFEGNHAGEGGGIKNRRHNKLTVLDTTFTDNFAYYGAGIHNLIYGELHVTDSAFYSNTARYNGGAIYNQHISTATITSTIFYSNSAGSYGGGIYNYEGNYVEISNSTFNNNSAGIIGGGIDNNYGSEVQATNLTFDGNRATNGGSDISSRYVSAFYIQGSILSGDTALGNCYEETGLHAAYVYDDGYNIIEDGSCITDPTSFAANPQLGPLQDNGGNTDTQALLEGSPAIDAIPPGSCAVTEDQRGVIRPQGAGCDIGAFEIESEQAAREIFLPLVVK